MTKSGYSMGLLLIPDTHYPDYKKSINEDVLLKLKNRMNIDFRVIVANY